MHFNLTCLLICKLYSIVNVEKLHLYEPHLIYDQGNDVQLPSIEDFLLEISG